MSGAKTEMMKQAIVRYIADNKLQRGDKLPSQTDLRHIFKVGSTTIGSALKELADDRVLELRDKVGVFVKNADLDGHTGRNIAILTNVSNSIYTHILVSQLQKYLQENNCRALMFSCPADKTCQRLKNYPGLIRNIREKKIAGVILTCELSREDMNAIEKSGITCFDVVFDNTGFNSCNINHQQFINEAYAYFAARGAKRPMCLSIGIPGKLLMPEFLEDTIRQHYPSIDSHHLYMLSTGFTHAKTVAEEFLKMDEETRPDALVFTGDLIMQGVTGWLNRLQAGKNKKYCPAATAILNKQNPVFPLLDDLTIFELDIEEQAKVSIEKMMEAFRQNKPVPSIKIPARRVSMEQYFANSMIPPDVCE